MNDTKWDELRLGMHGLEIFSPRWRTKDAENGYVSEWDTEWFHHFRIGGYATIVSSAKVPEDVVYEVVRAVFENLDD